MAILLPLCLCLTFSSFLHFLKMNRNFNHCSFLGPGKKDILFPSKQEREEGKKKSRNTHESAWGRKENYCMNNRYERLSCSKVWLLQQRQDGAGMFFPGWISILTGLVLPPEVHTNNHCNTWMELKMSRLIFFCINTATFMTLSLSITFAISSTWSACFNTCEFYHPLVEKYVIVPVRGCRKKKKWE